jgi:hypothetical protein
MILNWDFARLLNSTLLIVTVYKMTVVTWRLAPRMKWFELVGRQGITLTFLGFTGAEIVGITKNTPYSVFTFVITAGLATCAVGFIAWAHTLPRRQLRRPKKETR